MVLSSLPVAGLLPDAKEVFYVLGAVSIVLILTTAALLIVGVTPRVVWGRFRLEFKRLPPKRPSS